MHLREHYRNTSRITTGGDAETRASASLQHPQHDDDVVEVAVNATGAGARGFAYFVDIASDEHEHGPDERSQKHEDCVTDRSRDDSCNCRLTGSIACAK